VVSEPSPFLLSPVPPASADPRLLTLHLDICRMKAELELLEARINRIRAGEAEAAADTRPFVDRAQDLLDRTVASIYESGRAEIEATDRQSRLDAEARLAEASRQAQMLLAAAREELAAALTERVEAVEPTTVAPAEVVILPDDGLLALPGDDLIVLPDPGLVVVPSDDAVVSSDGGLPIVAEEEADALLVGPGEEALLVRPEHDESDQLEEPPVVDASAVEAPPVGDVSAVEETPADDVSAVEETPADDVSAVEETPADDVSAVEETPADDVPTGGSLNLPGLSGSWSSSDLSRTPSATGMPEASQADAAFDVWLAMAPPVAPGEDAPTSEAEGKVRPGWLRPLEAAAALVLVAILVTVALIIVG
jgi:hypothetical protein